MTDQRLNLLVDWLKFLFGDENFVIARASDDASFRRYFRIKRSKVSNKTREYAPGYNATFIAMDAPPEKEDNETFVKITNLLKTNKLHVPKIIEFDLSQGFLLIEDLGDTTFLQALDESERMGLYQKAIDELIKMQAIKRTNNNLPIYDDALLKIEMQLLIDWYLVKSTSTYPFKQLQHIFQLLSDNALNSSQVFVHRDYHARNMMMVDGEIAIIDFQDALIGSNTYDLCSLLKDAYLELSVNEIQTLLHYYYKQAGIKVKFSEFEKQFELMGLQRHLKILGIFKRLSIRDGKHQYLDDIPLVKKYVLQIADKYPEFSLLRDII